ncbi:MAG: CHAT domain-containing protein [Chloroflexaceae bacterium]|nr:CHAT domain-containing protein [Chloroflexaceae bacterium]
MNQSARAKPPQPFQVRFLFDAARSGYLRANLHQPRETFLGGGTLPDNLAAQIALADIERLRNQYDQYIALMHQWAAHGQLDLPLDGQPSVRWANRLPRCCRRRCSGDCGQRTPVRIACAVRSISSWMSTRMPRQCWRCRGSCWCCRCPNLRRQRFCWRMDRCIWYVRCAGWGGPYRCNFQRRCECVRLLQRPKRVRPLTDAVEPTHAALTRLLAPDALIWEDRADTLGLLQHHLQTTNPPLLHLLCHGQQSATGHGVRHDLLFTHPNGKPQRVNAHDLAAVLSLAPALQVIVLHACHLGSTALDQERQTTEGVALTLLRSGVPLVIAMQGRQSARRRGLCRNLLPSDAARQHH